MNFKNILNFYISKEKKSRKSHKKPKHPIIPRNIKAIKGKGSYWEKTRKLLGNKFCNCIKALNKTIKNEGRSIAICTKSIFTNKGLKRTGTFSCTKKRNKGVTFTKSSSRAKTVKRQ